MSDATLIDAIVRHDLAACIVITKHSRRELEQGRADRLRALNEKTPGMPIRAFAALSGLAPKVDGGPTIIGPGSSFDDTIVPTIRTFGYRRHPNANPPLVHAKLALLGHLNWHDEDGSGHVADVVWFTPQRLWISSANFTWNSRRHLEFGYWTEEPALVKGAERFLVQLMRHSESLDPETDAFDPELVPVEFDDAAMAEAMEAQDDAQEWMADHPELAEDFGWYDDDE